MWLSERLDATTGELSSRFRDITPEFTFATNFTDPQELVVARYKTGDIVGALALDGWLNRELRILDDGIEVRGRLVKVEEQGEPPTKHYTISDFTNIHEIWRFRVVNS